MSDRTAFIRTIHAAPRDDAPRLVFADYLDENGESERAALIRRMVRVPSYLFRWSRKAKHGRHTHAESFRAIHGLKGAIERLYCDEWGRLPSVEEVAVRRGLIEAITIPPTAFLTAAGSLFAAHPIVRVTLRTLRPASPSHAWPQWDAFLVSERLGRNLWPVQLFPELSESSFVYYPTRDAGLVDLSRRAVGYGRRMAGMSLDPPAPMRPTPGRRVTTAVPPTLPRHRDGIGT